MLIEPAARLLHRVAIGNAVEFDLGHGFSCFVIRGSGTGHTLCHRNMAAVPPFWKKAAFPLTTPKWMLDYYATAMVFDSPGRSIGLSPERLEAFY